jgi:ribosomal-protein-alanine N-acetyltransferase
VAFQIDRMTVDDVAEVMAIERDSFMTPWPSSAYRRELGENRNAHYLVLRMEPRPIPAQPEESGAHVERKGFLSGFLPIHRNRDITPAPADQQSLAGYAGLWLMIDEAHITTIAVRPEFRGRGLGELLLIALTEIALDINAKWLTLEVRVTNSVAQTLYRKYGFKPAGVRQRYYSDNHEDALIMWTDEIQSPEYLARFQMLRDKLRQRLESAGEVVARADGLGSGGAQP